MGAEDCPKITSARVDGNGWTAIVSAAGRCTGWKGGRLHRGALWASGRAGKIGNALKFDGKGFVNAGQSEIKLDYRDPFTFSAWIKPDDKNGAILSKGEDYAEGQQHGLYLMDGRLRLHVTFRWTDLAMRVETENPLALGEWQHVAVTYDGGMKASGVRMYVNGVPQPLKILFDQLIWPIDNKEPWRIGAGGGLRFRGSIDEVRVYGRALEENEIHAVAQTDSVGRIAAIPRDARTVAQQDKLSLCYLNQFASPSVQRARSALVDAERERNRYYESVATVMVMKERERPRDTFVLKRGAYDAPGDKRPAVPRVLPPLPPEWPANRLGLAKWLVDRKNPLTAQSDREPLLGHAVRNGARRKRWKTSGPRRVAGQPTVCSTGSRSSSWTGAGA